MNATPHIPRSGRPGLGATLFAIWNIGMVLLAMHASQSYESCQAQPTYWKICIDFTGPILILLGVVDTVWLVIAAIVHGRPTDRARAMVNADEMAGMAIDGHAAGEPSGMGS